MDTEYRFEWAAGLRHWPVSHIERGNVGAVVQINGSFVSEVWGPDFDSGALAVGMSKTLKQAVEQVIWYDRAMNQEAE